MIFRRTLISIAAACALLAAPVFAADPPVIVTDLKPASPQPAADKLNPGLAVVYFHNMFKKLDEIGKIGKGKPGEPIKILDHKTQDGNVLTDNLSQGVGAKIAGFIKFDKPGKYVLQMNSNDGARFTVAGKKVLEDDGVHADEMSTPAELTITEAGWYELAVDYFQRKGTSALQLFWTVDGGTQAIVPASQYAHLKN